MLEEVMEGISVGEEVGQDAPRGEQEPDGERGIGAIHK